MKIIFVLHFVFFFAQHEVRGQGQSSGSAKSSQSVTTDFSEPGPIQLLDFTSGQNNTVIITKGSLEKLFLDPNVLDREVVVISIAGALRRGKSFLLNYMLRYLYANYKSVSYPSKTIKRNEGDDWLGSGDEPLKGFPWKSSTKRETVGIVFWSDIFLHDSQNGRRIAIYLMDTQGLFDHSSTPTDNIRIFSLSALISSVQMMNIYNMITESDLEYLQFATEIARFSAIDPNSDAKPFQRLMFVIRDWNSPADYSFGLQGGNDFIKKFLTVKDSHIEKLRTVREYLHNGYDKIGGFLMPYPGKSVAINSSFDGHWSAIEEDFVDTLKELMPAILNPANFTVKTVNGAAIKAFELSVYIKQYVELFKEENLPEAKSIYESTLDNQFQILMGKSVEVYLQSVSFYQNKIEEELEIDRLHQISKNLSMKFFDDEKKFGTEEERLTYRKQLDESIEKAGKEWMPIALEFLSKIGAEQEKTNKQKNLAIAAEKREQAAKDEAEVADETYLELKQKLAQAKYDSIESRREAENIRKKFVEAEEQRKLALQREQDAKAYYLEMQRRAEHYAQLLLEERQKKQQRIDESVQSVRKKSGVLQFFESFVVGFLKLIGLY